MQISNSVECDSWRESRRSEFRRRLFPSTRVALTSGEGSPIGGCHVYPVVLGELLLPEGDLYTSATSSHTHPRRTHTRSPSLTTIWTSRRTSLERASTELQCNCSRAPGSARHLLPAFHGSTSPAKRHTHHLHHAGLGEGRFSRPRRHCPAPAFLSPRWPPERAHVRTAPISAVLKAACGA